MDLLFEIDPIPYQLKIEPLTLSDKESIYQLIERYSYE
jgi:hypothetical protein